jgi:imidazolonepropionase-like amidohydrolase
MPRSPLPGVSRRRLLGGSAAAALLAACASDDAGTGRAVFDRVDPDAAPTRGAAIALVDLRLPGQDDRIALTIDGGRIAQIDEGPADGVAPLDMGGATAIPGFIDAHVHMQFAAAAAVLAGGVTAVRDLGGPPDAAQALRGTTPLQVHIAGRILTAVAGYPTRSWGADGTGREIVDPDDAEAAVDEQVEAGAVVLKIALEDAGGAPIPSRAVLERIVARGRDLGLRTTAHVGSAAMLDLALEVGIDELCHLPLHDVTPAEMVRVAEAGVVLVPTLEIRGDDPSAIEALAAFVQAGGEVLYGTDLGNAGTSPGIAVSEVEAMLAAGLSPAAVLRSATSGPAAHLGLDTGRLEPGLIADVVVLGSDPFDDPRAYDDVRLVVAGGEIVYDGTR